MVQSWGLTAPTIVFSLEQKPASLAFVPAKEVGFGGSAPRNRSLAEQQASVASLLLSQGAWV